MAQKSFVRLHNLLALRSCYALESAARDRLPLIFGNPRHKPGEVSMLTLDEFQGLLAMPGVHQCEGDQCPFGSPSAKPTAWVFSQVDFSDMPRKCRHLVVPWYSTVDNTKMYARHMPTRGKVKYERQPVASHMLQPAGSDYISAGLAAYPVLLNKYLAAKLALAAGAGAVASNVLASSNVQSAGDTVQQVRPCPDARFGSEQIAWSQPLRGPHPVDVRVAENDRAIGGLRDAHGSLQRLPQTALFGLRMGAAIRQLLLDDLVQCSADKRTTESWVMTTCALIGTDNKHASAPEAAVAAVRRVMVDSPPLGKEIFIKLVLRWL